MIKICKIAGIMIIVAAFCSPGVSADERGCFGCSDLLKIKNVTDPAISPDGSYVAFVVVEPPDTSEGEKTYQGDIWMVDFDGNEQPRPFAFGPADERSPVWSPDGSWLAFTADREGKGRRSIYRIRFAGGEAEELASFDGSVVSFAYSPDGGRLAAVVIDGPSRAEEEMREKGFDEELFGTEERYKRLWIVNVHTGSRRLVSPDSMNVEAISWSPDGSKIAAVVSKVPGSNAEYFHSRLELLNPATGAAAMLSERAQGRPEFSSDGSAICFMYPLENPNVTVPVPVVAVIGTNGKGLKLLGVNYDGTLNRPVWDPGTEKLFVFDMAHSTARFSLLSVEDDSVEPVTKLYVPYYGGDVFDVSKDGSKVVYVKGASNRPGDLYSRGFGFLQGEKRLTHMNDFLDSRRLPEEKVVEWQSRDGTNVEGILVLPPGWKEKKRYPAVLCIHGGPMWAWWLGWHGSWHEWAIPLACDGYVVLLPNPRGSLGYGVGFARANFEDWGGGDFEDIMAGADFLVNGGYADPARIGIGGWSYGGYMTSWAVTHTKRFKAAVVGAGVTNLFSFHGTTDITPTFLRKYFGGIAYRRPDTYRSHSAVNYVERAATPTLVLHGMSDKRVPTEQGLEFFRALDQVGVETKLVLYPREGHGFREVPHQLDLINRVLDWFDEHLKK
ncbi:MAG: hypothetical protein B6D63_02475 [Candidatus Latescibacteria bacterium 4484_7]|nr:MAG: hypothetical protein B6D63_02475 [Candidatus Latescibacteria bacterium 4484_7]